MQQMAEELQLSRRVISAVINGNPGKVRISAATEQRIRNYLAASGYVRSRSALQLKQGGNSEQVGIFLLWEICRTELSYRSPDNAHGGNPAAQRLL